MRPRLLVLAGLLLALVGCGSPTAPAPTAGELTPTAAGVAAPAGVEVPAIGAHSTLIPTGKQPDGALETPPVDQPGQASWWDGSPRPGQNGPAVVLGHVDGRIDGKAGQPGVFARLHDVVAGDDVYVDRVGGSRAHFVVYAVEQHGKDDFPTDHVYGDTVGPELRLITCGGVFDHAAGHYVDNVVVFARLA